MYINYFNTRQVANFKQISTNEVKLKCINGEYKYKMIDGMYAIESNQFKNDENFFQYLNKLNEHYNKQIEGAKEMIELWSDKNE